jgi:NAD(P)-dependent dehydrogenase (short-subunit alcohol dehydrogenase family)
LRLFADEAVDRQIVESLRSAGIDVSYAAETDAAAFPQAPALVETKARTRNDACSAGAVLFLASDDADFITGQTISVSGGLTMHG